MPFSILVCIRRWHMWLDTILPHTTCHHHLVQSGRTKNIISLSHAKHWLHWKLIYVYEKYLEDNGLSLGLLVGLLNSLEYVFIDSCNGRWHFCVYVCVSYLLDDRNISLFLCVFVSFHIRQPLNNVKCCGSEDGILTQIQNIQYKLMVKWEKGIMPRFIYLLIET